VKALQMSEVVLIFEEEDYRKASIQSDMVFERTLVINKDEEPSTIRNLSGSCHNKRFEYFFSLDVPGDEPDRLVVLKRDKRKGTMSPIQLIEEVPVSILHYLSTKKKLSSVFM
jgi:hypothetical protein